MPKIHEIPTDLMRKELEEREKNEAEQRELEADPYFFNQIKYTQRNAKTKKPLVNSPNNVLIGIRALFGQKLAFNAFTYKMEILEEMELKHTPRKIPKGEVPEDIWSLARTEIEYIDGVNFALNHTTEKLEAVARENQYHPIYSFLEDCEKRWDGRKRIEELFIKWFGAEDSWAIREAAVLMLLGAVHKIYTPRVMFDYCFDLVGPKGIGKSKFFELLSKGFYSEGLNSFKTDDTDSLSKMSRSWFIVDDELRATQKTGFNETKAFISQTELEFRGKYKALEQKKDKHFVIVRTTNFQKYLADKSGDRRFVPIQCSKDNLPKDEKGERVWLTEEDVVQLWGEAMNIYRKGNFSIQPNNKRNQAFEKMREPHFQENDTELRLLEMLEIKIFEGFERQPLSVRQDWYEKWSSGVVLEKVNIDNEWVNVSSLKTRGRLKQRQFFKATTMIDEMFGRNTTAVVKKEVKKIMENHESFKYGTHRKDVLGNASETTSRGYLRK